MAIVCVTVVLFAFILGWYLNNCKSRNVDVGSKVQKRLPGPLSLPFIGSAIQIGLLARKFKHFKVFEEFCKQYGPIVGIKAGSQYIVVVEDYETAKAVLHSEAWADRMPANTPMCQVITSNRSLGMMFAAGEIWKENRKFVLTKLRESGFSERNTMESHLNDEIGYFHCHFDRLRVETGNVVAMQSCFKLSSLNILWRTLTSTRFLEEDQEVRYFIHRLEKLLTSIPVGTEKMYAFPWLTRIPGLTPHQDIVENETMIRDYFRIIIKNRRADGNYMIRQNDFIDTYLKKIDEMEDTPRNIVYSDDQLIQTCTDIFMAGADTTGSALEFAIFYMLLFPEVQRRVQKEIDSITSCNPMQVVTLKDRERMPYTEAVLLETLRYSTIIPIIPRANNSETILNGCYIPKGTFLLINAYKLNHDRAVWGDPEAFRPERFLDENLSIMKDSSNKLLTFGAGRRLCSGVTSAKASIFKFFTSVLQKYSLEPSPDHPLGPIDHFDTGINNKPKAFHCIATLRE